MSDAFTTVRYGEGDHLVTQGDAGLEFIILRSGRARALVALPNAPEAHARPIVFEISS